MNSMLLSNDFVLLFTEMNWVVIVLVVLGLILLAVEALIPGFGICGILGIVAELAGVVCQAVFSQSAAQVGILILLIVVVVIIGVGIFMHSIKKGWLKKTALVENQTAIPVDYSDESKNQLRNLIGESGFLVTDCKPIGKAKIGKNSYEVVSVVGMIDKGSQISVCDVKGTTIYVKKFKPKKVKKEEGK